MDRAHHDCFNHPKQQVRVVPFYSNLVSAFRTLTPLPREQLSIGNSTLQAQQSSANNLVGGKENAKTINPGMSVWAHTTDGYPTQLSIQLLEHEQFG